MRPSFRTFLIGSLVPAVGVAAAFYRAAWPVGRGWFPAPLDDVYIHFDFARSLAEGHPFEWIPGNGYSSGETAPLYALVLAVGHLVGFREARLGLFAAAIGVLATAWLVTCVRTLVARTLGAAASTGGGRIVLWLAPLVVLAVGLVDWSLVSGMEVALHAGLLGSALVALDDATSGTSSSRGTREHAQWRLGLLLAALGLVRPESLVLTPVLAVAAVRAIGPRSALAALSRVGLPSAFVTGLLAALNLHFTGEASAAGAQLKLLFSNPFLTNEARATAYVENVIGFVWRGIGMELVPVRAVAWALSIALFAAIVRPRTRVLATASLTSAVLWVLLASANGNAPFHNLRYYVPALLLVLVPAALGVAAVGVSARRRAHVAALVLLGLVATPALGRLPAQIDYFARCTRNIRDQQVEMGLVVARTLPRDARVLLGDAGAIPYVSRRGAVDALGLGGYHRLPFARAAVHGEVSVAELLEHLPASERPTHLALYPNWFAFLSSHFGEEVDRVTIQDNVICGGPTKILYAARFDALASADERPPPGRVDELDVADILSERAHGYLSPAPIGGFTVGEVRLDEEGARRFDGGRVIPQGRRESFRVQRASHGPVVVTLRTDRPPRVARVIHQNASVDLEFSLSRAGAWALGRAQLPALAAGDVLVLEAVLGELRDFHVYVDEALGRAPAGG